MTWKQNIKRILPRAVHHTYNRVISRWRIRRARGHKFDLEWKRKALRASDQMWVETYDRSWEAWTQEDLSPRDIEKLRGLVPPVARVLDAGCGNGYLLEALRDSGRTLTGVDVSGAALKQARRRLGPQAQLVQAFLEKLPFADRVFDVVLCVHTLEHVRDLDAALTELKRVAAHRLVILVPAQEYLPYTEDYHVHFFPRADDLLACVNLPHARCERYTVPEGECAYSGDVLLLVADRDAQEQRDTT